MNFGIDIDGVVTRYPEVFRTIGRALRRDGHHVYVITGNSLSSVEGRKKDKYPVLRDDSWYDRIITTQEYNPEELRLVPEVIAGRLDNHVLCGKFKRRVCRDLGIAAHFDDDVEHVRKKGEVPVFGVAKQ